MSQQSNKNARIACVLIAAGNSSRLGFPKQLVKLNGQNLLERSFRHIKAQTDFQVVVLGSTAKTILSNCKSIEGFTVENIDWQKGMGSSISIGVKNLSEDIDAVLILTCDLWKLTESDIHCLVSCFRTSEKAIVAAKYRSGDNLSFGVPAIFSRQYFNELILLKNTGAKHVIQNNLASAELVAIENAHFDLDTIDDLEILRQYERESNNSIIGRET